MPRARAAGPGPGLPLGQLQNSRLCQGDRSRRQRQRGKGRAGAGATRQVPVEPWLGLQDLGATRGAHGGGLSHAPAEHSREGVGRVPAGTGEGPANNPGAGGRWLAVRQPGAPQLRGRGMGQCPWASVTSPSSRTLGVPTPVFQGSKRRWPGGLLRLAHRGSSQHVGSAVPWLYAEQAAVPACNASF